MSFQKSRTPRYNLCTALIATQCTILSSYAHTICCITHHTTARSFICETISRVFPTQIKPTGQKGVRTKTAELYIAEICIAGHCYMTKLFCQQMHFLLKHKMLQFTFKISFLIWLLHVSVLSDHHQGA